MRVSCVLPETEAQRHGCEALTQAGDTPAIRTIRILLTEAGEARARGDRALADMLEQDAALVLRLAREEAGHHA